jgi:hypothetical protein
MTQPYSFHWNNRRNTKIVGQRVIIPVRAQLLPFSPPQNIVGLLRILSLNGTGNIFFSE